MHQSPTADDPLGSIARGVRALSSSSSAATVMDLDSLTDDQRAVLQQFQSITNTEDLDTAIVVLQSTEWDLEVRSFLCSRALWMEFLEESLRWAERR